MKKRVPEWLLVTSLIVTGCAHDADENVSERAQIGAPSVDCDAMAESDDDAGLSADAGGSQPTVDAGVFPPSLDAGIVVMRDADVVLTPEPEPERDPDCDFITYESFGESFFTSYCTDCHTGATAPGGVDLSTLEGIRKNKDEIAEHALGMPSHNPMPPPALPQPPGDLRDMLEKFLECGPN